MRLASQHRIWAANSAALWERARFPWGGRILDFGCGPGFATIDLASLVGPDGHVIGVDASPKFIAHLRRLADAWGYDTIEAIECDARDLALPANTLDGAYARWVMCFLPDPDDAVARIADALKPGASLAVFDYFNYRAMTLAPRSDAFDRVIAAVEQSWSLHGGDLSIQGRMPAIMDACGLDVVEITPVCRVARPGTPLWNWPRVFFDTFLDRLVDLALISASDADAFNRDWADRTANPHAYLCLPPMYDIIGVKRAT